MTYFNPSLGGVPSSVCHVTTDIIDTSSIINETVTDTFRRVCNSILLHCVRECNWTCFRLETWEFIFVKVPNDKFALSAPCLWRSPGDNESIVHFRRYPIWI